MTSWGHPKDVTLRMSLWNVFRTFLQNWKNMQKLTFYYLIHTFGELKLKMLPQWIKNNTTVMCFVIYFQIGVLRTSRVSESLTRETSVTEKSNLRKNWPFLNIEETETLAFTYDRPFHMTQIHIKLPMNQKEPSGKI